MQFSAECLRSCFFLLYFPSWELPQAVAAESEEDRSSVPFQDAGHHLYVSVAPFGLDPFGGLPPCRLHVVAEDLLEGRVFGCSGQSLGKLEDLSL